MTKKYITFGFGYIVVQGEKLASDKQLERMASLANYELNPEKHSLKKCIYCNCEYDLDYVTINTDLWEGYNWIHCPECNKMIVL